MQWVRRVLRGIVFFVLLLIGAALFYILVIMGDTGPEESTGTLGSAAVVRQAQGRQQDSKGVWQAFL